MEALGSTFTTTLAAYRIPHRRRADFRGRAPLPQATKPFFVESGGRCSSRSNRLRADVRMDAAVGGEEEETRQAKEMAAARRRWESLIREQKVKVLTPREAGYAIQLSNKALLDVRPSTEHEKAWVRGSTWVPIFDIDKGSDVGALSRKITNFAMGGWWSGNPMLAYDKDFVNKVEEKFPKDTDIVVVCQKGLRSLAACEQLYNAGFRNLFWVQGGLEASEEELDGPTTRYGFQGRLELSVGLHRTSAWTYCSGGCFVSWGSKARSLSTRVAVTLMRFIDHSKSPQPMLCTTKSFDFAACLCSLLFPLHHPLLLDI
ncbi:rhodanese-like domain-containing protein 11, chloroplastic isoform X1 [Zingiber officinale]|uniref:rhodanese-like domain-containing protein 11, chloroplastic isoform X1 n=1 Tax=Zingiber officinale TaxID=94328 RepID=UPI001C4C1048|nr:rhodanese-like domain-containing protein 11, chloroplastic isoform X1 [Zingiber officinale]